MESSAPGSGTAMGDVKAMMKELGLTEDNLEDVVIGDDDLPQEATRWMAIAPCPY